MLLLVLGIGTLRMKVKERGDRGADVGDRLAPEHPWPGSHEDVYDAVKWVSSLEIYYHGC